MESLKRKYKTAPIQLSLAQIELQFGKTKEHAAKDLKVSISTLKRKCKEHVIYEWQGPPKPAKRKVNYFHNQSDMNEEDSGSILVPSASERNENTLTIKAELIKFRNLEANLDYVENEISNKFKLTPGTYNLKYYDEEGDWILLTSDDDIIDCIRSSKKLGQIAVRLLVELSA